MRPADPQCRLTIAAVIFCLGIGAASAAEQRYTWIGADHPPEEGRRFITVEDPVVVYYLHLARMIVSDGCAGRQPDSTGCRSATEAATDVIFTASGKLELLAPPLFAPHWGMRINRALVARWRRLDSVWESRAYTGDYRGLWRLQPPRGAFLRRGVRDMYETLQASGMYGVRAAIERCYAGVSALATAVDIELRRCLAMDLAAERFDQQANLALRGQGSISERIVTLEGVEARANSAFARFGIPPAQWQARAASWAPEVVRAYREIGAELYPPERD